MGDARQPTEDELAAAYAYVDRKKATADGVIGPAPYWHGWALREAFLAGIHYAADPAQSASQPGPKQTPEGS